MLNDKKRMNILEDVVKTAFKIKGKDSLLLDISDGSLCSFIGVSNNFINCYSIEDKQPSIDYYSGISRRYHSLTILNGTCKLLTPQVLNNQVIDILISEMLYYQMQVYCIIIIGFINNVSI